ncbi:NfeD family protein [Phenylobacterium immobile]|uniref:NfeD family protein n=1 Tax=Phenylobacterium immobile TaxID=21 RepID=UPI000B2DF0DE|nr:NfeD family protein [Phenylobacterium immobile]
MAQMASLYADHPLWMWLALAALLLAAEIGMGSGWLLWPAACAAATAFIAKIPGLNFPGALAAFAALTAATTLLSRRYMPKPEADGPDINDSAARLIGRRGRLVQALPGALRAMVDGKEWPVEVAGAEEIAIGAAVEVVAVRDSVLQVRSTPVS